MGFWNKKKEKGEAVTADSLQDTEVRQKSAEEIIAELRAKLSYDRRELDALSAQLDTDQTRLEQEIADLKEQLNNVMAQNKRRWSKVVVLWVLVLLIGFGISVYFESSYRQTLENEYSEKQAEFLDMLESTTVDS